MKTTNYDIIGNAAPLDAKAATVRDGVGEHWEPKALGGVHHWDTPPPLLSSHALKRFPSGALIPVGYRKGRLSVVGVLDVVASGQTPGKWARTIMVCRCVCGDYEGRRSEKLRKNPESDDCCYKCRRLDELRQRSAKPSTKKSREKDAKRLDALIRRAAA